MTGEADGDRARPEWMSALSCARREDLDERWAAFAGVQFTWLKKPEFGAALVRGRMNGKEAEFNIGELTLTRCSVQLEQGEVGLAYVPGCDKRHAMMAAVLDALLQGNGALAAEAKRLVADLVEKRDVRRDLARTKTQASSVDFTMAQRD
jgi:alpha-D-ribose 1-methylphosphonate 5-triphosphate synthase subunit PhnG